MGKPLWIFISYSDEDDALRAELVAHLAPLKRQGLIEVFYDKEIPAGTRIQDAIAAQLAGANVILLLVSKSFLASDYLYNVEMAWALERHQRGQACVMPVILRPTDWQSAPFGRLRALPTSGKPVTSWIDRDEAWLEVVQGIRAALVGSGVEPVQRAAPTPSPTWRAPAVPGAALHQLRSPPADFTGREAELTELRAKLDSNVTSLVGLTGQGGVGKTALALQLASELRERYPDAQIDINLQGADREPISASQVMAEVIHAFEPEIQLPDEQSARARLYRSCLYAKRALLLFDDAYDRAQIEPLLPPPGCLLLVTSRQHFTLPGLYARRLDTLTETDAATLVRRIAPRLNDATTAELVKVCGYLPIALRAAASTLAERRDLKPAKYLKRLWSAHEQMKLIEAVLASSLDLLDERVLVFWLRLGVMPADFDESAAASVGDVDDEEAEKRLSDLVRRNLLDWDDATEHYRMHDLAGAYARSRLDEAELFEATRRHATHFLAVEKTTNDLYVRGGGNIIKALTNFDRNQHHINAAQAWATAHAGDDDVAARICCDFPLVGANILMLRQRPRERIAWLEAALLAAQRLRMLEDAGKVLGNLGIAYTDVGEPERAIGIYERRLAIARKLGDRRGEGRALGNLGIAYADLGEPQKSISCYEQTLAIARDLGDKIDEGTALGALGRVHASLGATHDALDLYEQSLRVVREIGDRHGEGVVLGRVANIYRDLGDVQNGIELYKQAIAINRELGDRHNESINNWNLGLAYERVGDLPRAIDAMQVTLDYYLAIGHRDLSTYEARIAQLRARLEK